MKMSMKIELKRIESYNDVSKGWLVISDGERTRELECFWRTDIGCVTKGSKELPGGESKIKYKMIPPYRFSLIICVNMRVRFRVLPLKVLDYDKLGGDILIRNRDGSVVGGEDYTRLAMLMQHSGVTSIMIDSERKRMEGNMLKEKKEEYKWFD